jgi:hypothetical protein
LRGLYLVQTKEADMLSEATCEMQELFLRIGVSDYDLPA